MVLFWRMKENAFVANEWRGGGGGLAMCLMLAVTRSRPVIMTEL